MLGEKCGEKKKCKGRIVENDTVGERETHKGENYTAVWIRVVEGK